jgi:3-hydroxyacyl-CoA dehydrogenase
MSVAEQDGVTRVLQDGVLDLVIDAAPAAALSQSGREALLRAVDEAIDHALNEAGTGPQVRAIVLRAEGRNFPVGPDIADADHAEAAPSLAHLCDRIETCPVPVVVALHGAVLGGGLELALAAHLRVALADARLGLPEISLGILPGSGGTQRLPRLIGAQQALRMMLSGRPVPAPEALAMGLVDRVVESGLAGAAQAAARDLAGTRPVRTRDRRDGMRDALSYQKTIAAARAGGAKRALPAAERIIDCVEAAQLLPFDQGMAFERAALEDLRLSPEAAALRHVFLAERAAARIPETRVPPARALEVVGIAGAAGADHALACLQAGLSVTLVEPQKTVLVAALEKIAAEQQAAVAAGRLTEAARDADWARLKPAMDPATLATVDVVLIAHPDHLAPVAQATQPGVGLLHLGRGGALAGSRATDVLGLVMPGAGGRLAEVVVGPETAPAQVSQAVALLRRLGLVALRTSAPGGIAARVLTAGRAAAAHLAAQGQPPEVIAAALAEAGLPALIAAAPGALPPRAMADGIVDRCLSAMVVEGARLLTRGVARRPSDIDLALILGAGMARQGGGPMFWADRRGLMVLRRDLRLWAAEAGAIWGVPPLIEDLAARGGHFADLNAAG